MGKNGVMERAWVQKHSVCGGRLSNLLLTASLIVPIPQTACSAISRVFDTPLRDKKPFFIMKSTMRKFCVRFMIDFSLKNALSFLLGGARVHSDC